MTMLKTLALAAFGLCLAAPALAAPSLRGDITVTSEIVTVGDMFDDAGALAELGLFRAPQPGTTGIVSLDAVRRATALVGLTEFENIGIARVRVARASTIVDEPMLQGLLVDQLMTNGIVERGVVAQLRFDTPGIVYNAEAVAEPVKVISLRYLPATGGFTARLQIAGTDLPVDITGRLDLMIEVPHLIAQRPAGTVLSPADIEMKLVPQKLAEGGSAATLDQLVGKQLQRAGRGGLMLRASDVTEPLVIERNAMVTVYLRTGPMTLTAKGQALSNASSGQPVQVLNTATKKVLYGTAMANGGVEMTSNLAVAGL